MQNVEQNQNVPILVRLHVFLYTTNYMDKIYTIDTSHK